MVMVRDPLARQRYDREVANTNATADKVIGDAREAKDAGYLDDAAYARITEMAVCYRHSTIKLLRDIYEVNENE